MRAGRSGFLYTAISITFALTLGVLLGKLLQVGKKQSLLICFGTAICGGSAIAAIEPRARRRRRGDRRLLGTVFVLNSVALIAFPLIGWHLHLSQTQFGLWSALAIHDTSSVVGAAAKYGAIALAVGTTVKLARALWIVPLSLGNRSHQQEQGTHPVALVHPVLLLAAIANTYLGILQPVYPTLKQLGIIGLTVTLYLIGTGLSMKTIRQVGPRPLLQGILLWIAVASASLAMIRLGFIHL